MAGDELTCTVLFFASAADATGFREKELTLPSDATVGDAFDAVASACEQLAALKDHCALAIDQQLVPRDSALHDGCTVAILPPVSGG